MTSFGKPQRTSYTVFVPIENQRIRLVFNDISQISIRPSSRNPGGYTVTARFPADSWAGEQLEVLDAEALASTLANNKSWFKNALGEEQIAEFFEPSIQVSSKSAKAVFNVSPAHPPNLGSYETLDAFYESWSNSPHRGPHAVTATATVDVVGILFEKQRFRLRLMLRTLEMSSHGELSIEDDVPDRREIEDNWRREIDAVLNPEIAQQEQRLQKLISLRQNLMRQLEMAECMKENGPTWDAHLASIAQTLREWRVELSYIEYRPVPQ